MSHQRFEALLWSLALAGAVVTAVRLHARERRHDPAPIRPVPVIGDLRPYDEDLLLTAADSIASHDPFRLRRPSSKLAINTTNTPAIPAPPPLVPHLTVGGVMGGPPWRAVITGFPGRDGPVVVSAGDTVGALRVRAIRRDAVIMTGQDTTWTLTVR